MVLHICLYLISINTCTLIYDKHRGNGTEIDSIYVGFKINISKISWMHKYIMLAISL